MLSLKGVSVRYRKHQVVHNVSLDVHPGQVVALIGPSGAGKSSLLRCINFLEVPAEGTVHLAGHRVGFVQRGDTFVPAGAHRLAEHRREVGMVFQQFNLFPHLSTVENVMLAQIHALGRSRSAARERALQELAHVGLADKADALPAQCSGGQQQRIAIARALAMDPKLMLFDEATSALDPELAVEVLGTMRRLASEGMTMIVVTHEMHFAEEVADRVVFMADGRIIEEGSAYQVMRQPQHGRTVRFLSAVRGR
ncbi:amino acid ABC transporter ATP-binding protein [Streptomyces sp. AK04-3B]|uniref:amino acid ABC transporter ATP-binding protein n=1 Tax=Streptomyces sp. AK04-3B TaxID=3028650 RepID=UPI0029BA4441|nr:amino acid ABC transporter ATP-binding protein [Streptomyces sp. AK04-3B]MDX3800420.1 amino acid ABC transporter ATP-binding protein [Streptomyces sp. AK04-3B]